MKLFVRILFHALLLNAEVILLAQTPVNDKNWISTPYFIDDFDNQQNFNNNWNTQWDWGQPASDISYNLASNLVISGTILKCFDKYQPGNYGPNGYHYDYTGNLIFSKVRYSYGYFEMNCKMPLGTIFWSTFWLWGSCDNPDPDCPVKYIHEIDITEKYQGLDDFHTSNNLHWKNPLDSRVVGSDAAEVQNISFTDWGFTQGQSQAYYKYGVEWSPKWLYFYINNKCVRIIPNDDRVPFNPLAIISGFGVAQRPQDNSLFPAEMDIDWVKVFHLNTSGCSTLDYNYSGDFSDFNWGVKRTITINNGTTVNSDTNITVRARDGIIINGDFTVSVGAEFCAMPTNCY